MKYPEQVNLKRQQIETDREAFSGPFQSKPGVGKLWSWAKFRLLPVVVSKFCSNSHSFI